MNRLTGRNNRFFRDAMAALAVLASLFTLGCYQRDVAPNLPKNAAKIQKIKAQLYPGKGTETLPSDIDSTQAGSASNSNESSK